MPARFTPVLEGFVSVLSLVLSLDDLFLFDSRSSNFQFSVLDSITFLANILGKRGRDMDAEQHDIDIEEVHEAMGELESSKLHRTSLTLICQSDESIKPIIEVAEDASRDLAGDATQENQGEHRVRENMTID